MNHLCGWQVSLELVGSTAEASLEMQRGCKLRSVAKAGGS